MSKPLTKEIPLDKPFEVDHIRTFLTYPNCGLDHQYVINQLQKVNPISWIRVCRENHKTGEPHIHACVEWSKRMRSKSARVFDIDGYHPNIGAIRSVPKALEYCRKEDPNYADSGPIPTNEKRSWDEIVEAAKGDEVDFLRVVHEERLQYQLAKRLRDLQTWHEADLGEYDSRPVSVSLQTVPKEYNSLCIIGKPGIGKTGWAMQNAPRPALLVKHLDMLSKFRASYHKSIVFDDCDFKHLPRPTQLQICDYENQCQIHIRYSVALIPKHVPRLFLCNPGNEPFISDEAIQNRRVKYIYL